MKPQKAIVRTQNGRHEVSSNGRAVGTFDREPSRDEVIRAVGLQLLERRGAEAALRWLLDPDVSYRRD